MDTGEEANQPGRPRFVIATDDLCVGGITHSGMPLLLGPDGEPMEPAQSFVWDLLVEHGPFDNQTKIVYGRALFDFSAFCSVNDVDWRRDPIPGLPSALPAYREWARKQLGASTFNLRVRLVHRMYRWVLQHGAIQRLPYRVREALSDGGVDDENSSKYEGSSGLGVRAWTHELSFLSERELFDCKAELANPTHRLMFRLMEETGLRQCECRTFPSSYVFDPKSKREEYDERRRIRCKLNPADMHIKYGKERSIDIPQELMRDLWWYKAITRQKRMAAGVPEPRELFLTEGGQRYSPSGMQDVFKRLSNRMGFSVRAHMLRHSFAVHTLRRLRRSKTFEGDPLLYVRDRLGHSSVVTTMRYLKALNQLDASLALAHEELVDRRAMAALGA